MEAKDLLDYLGVEASDLESFKATFKENFIPKAEAADEDKIKSSVTGRITGAFKTKAKQLFDLDSEELAKAEKWEDILDMGVKKQNKLIEELRLSSTNTNDATITDLNSKLEKANQTVREYKEAKELLQNTLVEKENEWSGKVKQTKAQYVRNTALMSVLPKLSDTLGKGDKLLLDTEVAKLQIDFDDQDNAIVKDAEGKRIPNPKKIGDYLGLSEAIEVIAEREGFLKKNAGGQAPRVVPIVQQVGQATQTERQIHPNAQK